jgi:capsular polysaccharide export protein
VIFINTMHERAMIAFVIDSMERYYFARRLVNAVRKEFDFLFLTSEPIAHVRLCLSGFRSVYLHRAGLPRLRQDELVSRTGYETAIEVLNGHVTLERARRDADAICRIVSRAFRRFSVSQCLIWNGQQLLGRTISKVPCFLSHLGGGTLLATCCLVRHAAGLCSCTVQHG